MNNLPSSPTGAPVLTFARLALRFNRLSKLFGFLLILELGPASPYPVDIIGARPPTSDIAWSLDLADLNKEMDPMLGWCCIVRKEALCNDVLELRKLRLVAGGDG